MPPPPVLLTRPQAAAEGLAADLRRAGVEEIEVSPLLDIRFVDGLPPLADGLILTSPNGVAAYVALGGPAGRPVWCVGPRTAERAAAHGLLLQATAPDAEALADLIPADAPPLLHLRGEHQRSDLAGALRARGLTASDAVIYDQVAVPLTGAARGRIAQGTVLAPLYSPRTAMLLAEQVPKDHHGHVQTVCLSQAVADAAPFPCRAIADQPDGPAMMRAILSTLATIGG